MDPSPTKETNPKGEKWNRFFLLAGIILFAVLLTRLDAGTIWEQLKRIGWFVIPSILAYVGNQLAAARCWHVLLRPIGQDPGYGAVLRIMWMGHAINAITPGGGAGEIVKTTMLARSGIPATGIVASLIVYNIENTLVVGAFNFAAAILCWWLAPELHDATVPIVIGAGAAFVIITVIFLIVRSSMAGRTVRMLRRTPLVKRWITEPLIEKADQVDASVTSTFVEQRRAVLSAAFWATIVRVMQIFEVVFLLIPVVPNDLLVVVTLLVQVTSQLIVWIAAFVPSQVGVLAAGIAGVFKLANLDPASGFAVAVARRARWVFGVGVGLALGAHAQLRAIRDDTTVSH